MENRSGKPSRHTAGLLLLLMSALAMPATAITSLPACPDSPNCVSSQAADPEHSIEPFAYSGSVKDAMRRLKAALASEKRVTVISEQDGYLHVEVRSLVFRFVDDVEFLIDSGHGLIHVRSASRTGYSDLGVNRRRVERIRKSFMRAR